MVGFGSGRQWRDAPDIGQHRHEVIISMQFEHCTAKLAGEWTKRRSI
jgi:hypothetical protein